MNKKKITGIVLLGVGAVASFAYAKKTGKFSVASKFVNGKLNTLYERMDEFERLYGDGKYDAEIRSTLQEQLNEAERDCAWQPHYAKKIHPQDTSTVDTPDGATPCEVDTDSVAEDQREAKNAAEENACERPEEDKTAEDTEPTGNDASAVVDKEETESTKKKKKTKHGKHAKES